MVLSYTVRPCLVGSNGSNGIGTGEGMPTLACLVLGDFHCWEWSIPLFMGVSIDIKSHGPWEWLIIPGNEIF